MCGLAGGTGLERASVDEMLDRIRHRGPDGRGVFDHAGAVHGHVRLALVDLSEASAQPFRRASSTLTFNGEIWNFRELRAELEREGERFSTTGDTEVLSAFLCRRGLARLSALDGMFAFAWSSPKNEHWLVRDSFGKVPIYVARTRGGFIWASERKAFPPRIIPIALPPGHALNLNTGECVCWYTMPKPDVLDAAGILALLRPAVKKRLSADAPVCCLVSGGLDSSLILALAKEQTANVRAYTAFFDPESDDLKSARRVCVDLGVPLIEVPVTLDDSAIAAAIDAVEVSSKAQIEIAILCIPLARRIYADGFRACLSGEAADELFGGYGNFCIRAAKTDDAGVIGLRKAAVAKMARGNFVRCNKAFMAAGVECRLPFMEQRLAESAVQAGKTESPPGKKLLKEIARGLLPAWLINRQKETFQGGSGISRTVAERIASPLIFYNAELRRRFGYLPKD